MDGNVYISVEMSASNIDKARDFAKVVGYQEWNSYGEIFRLFTRSIPINNDVSLAVNEAMDDVCRVGKKVIDALDKIPPHT